MHRRSPRIQIDDDWMRLCCVSILERKSVIDRYVHRRRGGNASAAIATHQRCLTRLLLSNGRRLLAKGGATNLKVGGTICERSEQKNFFCTPHFLYSGGYSGGYTWKLNMKSRITVLASDSRTQCT